MGVCTAPITETETVTCILYMKETEGELENNFWSYTNSEVKQYKDREKPEGKTVSHTMSGEIQQKQNMLGVIDYFSKIHVAISLLCVLWHTIKNSHQLIILLWSAAAMVITTFAVSGCTRFFFFKLSLYSWIITSYFVYPWS